MTGANEPPPPDVQPKGGLRLTNPPTLAASKHTKNEKPGSKAGLIANILKCGNTWS
jgi:hypothetical protein